MQVPTIESEPLKIALQGPIKHGKSTMAAILQDIEPNSLYYESSTIISEVLNQSHQTLHEPLPSDRYTLINELLANLHPVLKKVVHVDVDSEALQFSQQDSINNPNLYKKLLEHATRLQAMPQLTKNEVNSNNKEYYRAGLQGLGGYLVSKVGATIWFDEIVRRSIKDTTENTNLIIVGGPRYPSDANVLKKAGYYIAEIYRPGALEPDINDPTEAHRRQIVSDTKIINNGDVENDLYSVGKAIYSDLVSDSLKPLYVAD